MRCGSFFAAGAAVVGLCALLLTGTAQAAFIVNLQEVGPDVVATGSGTLNLTDLVEGATGFSNFASIDANQGAIVVGGLAASTDSYGLVNGPTSFGSSGFIFPPVGSGDHVGVVGSPFPGSGGGVLLVPAGYVSGASLSDTNTWTGQSFASMSLITGTYVWTWGAGPTADSFTLNIGVTNTNGNGNGNGNGSGASVPLPAAALAGLSAIVAIATAGWARRRQTAAQ